MSNRINVKTSNTEQVFWVALGSLSTLGLSIVSAAILSRYLDKAEYGTYKQILYVYTTLLIVFSAGLPRVYAYFLPRYNINEGKAIVWKISKVLFLAGVLFSVFLFLFSGCIADILKNEKLAYGLKVFSPMPMLLLPTLGIEGIFSTYKKTLFLAIYNTLSRLLMLIFIVVPVILIKANYIIAIYGWLIASLIIFVMTYFFKGIPFKGVESKAAKLELKEIFAYSIPLVFASFWGIAIKAADEFYISRFFGANVFAEFSNGFIELPLVSMITTSTSVVLMPVFSRVIHENKGVEELVVTWKSVLNKSAMIIYPIVIFFMFFSTEVMVLMYSDVYVESGQYFRINMVLNFFNIIIFFPLMLSLGATKFYSGLHAFIAILAWIGGYLIMIIFNNPISLAIFSVSLSIVKVMIALVYVSKRLNVKVYELFPVFQMLKIILHTCVVMFTVTFFLKIAAIENSLINLIIAGLLYAMLVLMTGRFLKLNYLEFLYPLLNKIKKNG